MKNDRSEQAVNYMLRHYLLFNVTDPLPDAERGYSPYTQYFSGTNAAGQINYLERKPTTAGTFIVSIGGIVKDSTTDYTLDRTHGTITWITTPASGSDNIKVDYQAIMPWIYNDQPNLNANYFPRISVLEIGTDREDSGMGIYTNYPNGVGQRKDHRVKIIIRLKKNAQRDEYTYDSVHSKNYELALAVGKNVTDFFNENRVPILWKFWDWKVVREEFIYSEEETNDIVRRDITIIPKIFEGGA